MDMRINSVQNAYSTYATQRAGAPVRSRAAVRTDSVSVSAAANDYNLAHRAVADLPDVRAEQVSRLTAAVQSGAYNVSAADVAARIFGAQ